MIKVKVLKQGADYAGARFPTQTEADAWVADNVANNSWGKPLRWLTLVEADLEGLSVASNESRVRGMDDMGHDVIEYKVDAEYSIEVLDATAEYAEELAEQESSEAFQLSMQLKIKIRALNIKKLKSGAWNAGKWNQFRNDATMKQIQAAIDTASFNEAKVLVQSVNEDYYSADEKSKILSAIDAHLAKWP